MAHSAAARKRTGSTTRSAPRPAARPAAVMYARVSSKDQEKEGFSIPAQQKLLRTYAEEKGYAIKEEFTDVETAKKAGRTSFGNMLAWLRKNTTCKVILVEKTDRLYRNLKDWVELDGMDLEIHLVKEAIILSDDSRSSEKFIHGIKVLMAKNYIDNLSEEVRKGMVEKAGQGIWPSRAAIGYMNVSRADGRRIIVPDPDRQEGVRHIFESYASGRFTLKQLADEANRVGLKTRRGERTLALAQIHVILHNPIYKGEYVWEGRWFKGSHTPIVTPQLWARVQDVMSGRGPTHTAVQRHQFAFNGLVHCGVCADLGDRRLMVGEIQKGKYIYYHCAGCHRAGRKPKFIREDALSELFTRHLRRLKLDGVVLDWMKEALHDSHEDQKAFRKAAIARLAKQHASAQRKLDMLYDDRLDGRVTVEQYEAKADGLREELSHIRGEIERHDDADRAYADEGLALLELAGMALELWEVQEPAERRRLLDFLCSNCEFYNDHLAVQFKKPYDGLVESLDAANAKGGAFDESSAALPVWRSQGELNPYWRDENPLS